MAGWAALIGGAGSEAERQAEQIRPLLEQRRHAFADMIANQALQEVDPTRRAELLQHSADLYGGKDMGKIVPGVLKTLQTRQQSNAALGQAIGTPAPQPPPIPTPAGPSQTPGTATAPAAQPATSPVQPGAPGMSPMQQMLSQGITPALPTNQPPSPQESAQQPQAAAPLIVPPMPGGSSTQLPGMSLPEMESELSGMTPAMRQAVLPELSNMAQLRREASMIPFRTQMFNQLWNDSTFAPGTEGVVRSMAVSAAMSGQGGGGLYGLGSMMSPIDTTNVPGSAIPEGAKDHMGNPIDRSPGAMYQVQRSKLPGQPDVYMPVIPANRLETGPNGEQQSVSTHLPPGTPTGTFPQALVVPHAFTGPGGGMLYQSPFGARAGAAPTPIPGAFNPSMATITHAGSSEPTPSGGTATQTETSKGFPSLGAPAASAHHGGGTARPAGSGGVWGSVHPFDPTTNVDNLVKLIGQDAANKSLIPTRGPFDPINNPNKTMVDVRMAQLGIDPNNVSASVRDRAELAQTVLPHFDTVLGLIQQAKADGDMGVLMTRWNDLLTGKVGDDPTKGHIFSKLSTELTFLNSAIAMTHGGLRAAASPQVLEKWNSAIHAKDADTLTSQLGEAHKWLEGYASMAEGGKKITPGGISPTPGSSVVVSSQADYDKLPSGAVYTEDGHQFRKP